MFLSANHLSEILHQLLEAKLIREIDLAFAEFIYQQENNTEIKEDMAMLAALVSIRLSEQHTCVNLDEIDQPFAPIFTFPTADEFKDTIHGSHLVALASNSNSLSAALVLDNNRLYLHRYWCHEEQIVKKIKLLANQASELDASVFGQVLSQLFDTNETQVEIDWQKVAVAVAARQGFSIITGGPGTGKTTTVTRLMAALQALQKHSGRQPLKIALCAPTGKAAARLTESIAGACERLPAQFREYLPTQCSTIHRLLGSKPNSPHFKANADNPLHLDVLIVDEASMVDVALMSKLMQALPAQAKLILLGDQQQLSSVEVGCVLSDVCAAADMQRWVADQIEYSEEQLSYLQSLSCLPLEYKQGTKVSTRISDHLIKLWHSHRFAGNSGIGQLANAVNQGDLLKTKQLLNSSEFEDIHWHNLENQQQLVRALVPHYQAYFKAIKQYDLDLAFSILQQQILLCARQTGEWGVQTFNRLMALELSKQGLIDISMTNYPGRPLMLKRNDYQLGLFNGDIGVVMSSRENPNLIKVWFDDAEQGSRSVLPHQLPEHDSLFAMTIHKSQGSEFEQVHLCLPPVKKSEHVAGLNRELLYTGLTRAKKKFHLYANEPSIAASLHAGAKRGSGLSDKINKP